MKLYNHQLRVHNHIGEKFLGIEQNETTQKILYQILPIKPENETQVLIGLASRHHRLVFILYIL